MIYCQILLPSSIMFIALFLGALGAVAGQYVPSFPAMSMPVSPPNAATYSFNPPVQNPVALHAAMPSIGVVAMPGENYPYMNQDHARAMPAAVPQSRVGPASMSSMPAFQQFAPVSDAVATFAQHFSHMIVSSDVLRRLFDLQMERPAQVSDEYFHAVQNTLQKVRYPDPGDIAHFMGESIYSVADALSPELFATANSRAIGKFLVSQGKLSTDNALSLAVNFVTILQNTLNAANAVGRPITRIEAAVDGTADLLLSLGVSIPVHAYTLSRIFDAEYKAAKEGLGVQQQQIKAF